MKRPYLASLNQASRACLRFSGFSTGRWSLRKYLNAARSYPSNKMSPTREQGFDRFTVEPSYRSGEITALTLWPRSTMRPYSLLKSSEPAAGAQ